MASSPAPQRNHEIRPTGGPGSSTNGRLKLVHSSELATPALILDAAAFGHNLVTMAEALPGDRLRPHVKAHKCTTIAAAQAGVGHTKFTCATPREVIGMAGAGLGADLLLANEVLDTRRLRSMVEAVEAAGARVTVAIDSDMTLNAAIRGGVREVVIDIDVGLRRCGCDPDAAGRLAGLARAAHLTVRGVMGYEGHLMMVLDRAAQQAQVEASMALLLRAHRDVGGELVTAGGTGTYDINVWANEIQAGSYALMDTHYAQHEFPFLQALFVEATVIARNPKGWAVADCGLKALGMDHGNPTIANQSVWFCSDEHITFGPGEGGSMPKVGDRVRITPAHCDPTMALHERIWLVDPDGDVLDEWVLDLRWW